MQRTVDLVGMARVIVKVVNVLAVVVAGHYLILLSKLLSFKKLLVVALH